MSRRTVTGLIRTIINNADDPVPPDALQDASNYVGTLPPATRQLAIAMLESEASRDFGSLVRPEVPAALKSKITPAVSRSLTTLLGTLFPPAPSPRSSPGQFNILPPFDEMDVAVQKRGFVVLPNVLPPQ